MFFARKLVKKVTKRNPKNETEGGRFDRSGLVLPLAGIIVVAAIIMKLLSGTETHIEIPMLAQTEGLIEISSTEEIVEHTQTTFSLPTNTLSATLAEIGVYSLSNDLYPVNTIALAFIKDDWRYAEINYKPITIEEQLAIASGEQTKTIALTETIDGIFYSRSSLNQCIGDGIEDYPGKCEIDRQLFFQLEDSVVAISGTSKHITDGELIILAKSILTDEIAEETIVTGNEAVFIDTHTHLSKSRGETNEEAFLNGASKLISLMEDFGLGTAFIMPPPQNPDQEDIYDYTAFSLALDAYPNQLAFLGGGGSLNVALNAIDPNEVSEQQHTSFREQALAIIEAGAVGFGEMSALHMCLDDTHSYSGYDLDHPLLLDLMNISADYGIPIDMHMDPLVADLSTPQNLLNRCDKNPPEIKATVPQFKELLTSNENGVIVWQHVGWYTLGNTEPSFYEDMLDNHDNLYLSIRAIDQDADDSRDLSDMPHSIVDEYGFIREEWIQVIQAHPDRIMIGADDFIGHAGTSIHTGWFDDTWELVDQLGEEIAKKIGYENAARVYNLN